MISSHSSLVFAFLFLSTLSVIYAQNSCSGVKPPPSARGCFCFYATLEELGDLTNVTIPDIPDIPGVETDACIVAAKPATNLTAIFAPIAVRIPGKWTVPLGETKTKEICENGVFEGTQVYTKDHGREGLCGKNSDGSVIAESNSGGSDSNGSGKSCYSTDTDVILDRGIKKTMGDLIAGRDELEILYVQHGESVLRKDVLCVSEKLQGTLCATPDHVVKYFGRRYSMGEVCETIDCYERKNVRVVNPVLRSGIINSPLDGFELTDEVDWDYVPRVVTRVGARFLATAIEARNSMSTFVLSSLMSKSDL